MIILFIIAAYLAYYSWEYLNETEAALGYVLAILITLNEIRRTW